MPFHEDMFLGGNEPESNIESSSLLYKTKQKQRNEKTKTPTFCEAR